MIAEMIQAETGSDIACLDTVVPYEGTDQEIAAQGKVEVNEGYTPKLKPLGVSLDAYDTVILGTPTWWYTMAPAVLSFLWEKGSGFSGTIDTIQELQPNAQVVQDGLSISRNAVPDAAGEVSDWVSGLNL